MNAKTHSQAESLEDRLGRVGNWRGRSEMPPSPRFQLLFPNTAKGLDSRRCCMYTWNGLYGN